MVFCLYTCGGYDPIYNHKENWTNRSLKSDPDDTRTDTAHTVNLVPRILDERREHDVHVHACGLVFEVTIVI